MKPPEAFEMLPLLGGVQLSFWVESPLFGGVGGKGSVLWSY